MYELEDEKIVFNKNFNFDSLEVIGCGANSKVYKIIVFDKYYALKIFNNPNYWNLEKLEKKLDLNIPSFISPIKISYLNNKFNGYLMELCDGENLLRKNLEISVEDFIKNCDNLFSDTTMLSESKYLIQDISKSNIIFDNGFKVVDIDFYIYCPNWFCNDLIKDKDDIRKYNQRNVTNILVDVFIRNANLKNLFEKEIKLSKLKNDCVIGKISLKNFLNVLCGYIYNNEDYRNVKIQDVGKRLIKKY